MLITEEYKKLQTQMHAEKPESYGKLSDRWAPMLMQLCGSLETTDALDYGCGKGSLNLAMPFHVKGYDPGVPKFSIPPDPADVVFCTDVMEHVEPECLQFVIDDLARVTKKALMVAICTGAANKHLPDGRNAHLIQEGLLWWMEKFADWDIQALQFEGISLTMVLTPRKADQ